MGVFSIADKFPSFGRFRRISISYFGFEAPVSGEQIAQLHDCKYCSEMRFFKINYLSMNEQNLALDKNFNVVSRKVNASSPIARVSEIARFLELERRQHSVFKLDAFSFRPICKFFFE